MSRFTSQESCYILTKSLKMVLHNKSRCENALSLLLIISIFVSYSDATQNVTSTSDRSLSHLSWTSNNTRFDFVFDVERRLNGLIKLQTDSNNYLTNSLPNCESYSACLFRNGTFLEAFHVDNNITHDSIFVTESKPNSQCDIGNKIKISHYCNTHWNPPTYLTRSECSHIIEWHSPLRCHQDSKNHEHPCYTYDSNGKLLDLTPWILSNGSSYEVNLPESFKSDNIQKFNINICNEAYEDCGPNVSSCFVDRQYGMVESGYNNLTSVKYDAKDKTVLLTSLGHYKPQCEGDRMKTVIRFICRNNSTTHIGPMLTRSTACEQVLEWPTTMACPLTEVRSSATDCMINYEPLGVKIDIHKVVNNKTIIEVPDINLDGRKKKMILGICQGIPKQLQCEGKSVSTTKACLVDSISNSTYNASNSIIVGSVIKSFLRLSDDRVYLESFAPNKTCFETVRGTFNVTQQVGTRIEFFCAREPQDKPSFLGYDDCTYVFEWGSPEVCLETLNKPSNVIKKSQDKKILVIDDKIPSHLKNLDIKKILNNESVKIIRQEKPTLNIDSPTPKMNIVHKYFMISSIVMLFVAFIVIIFVLDKKTRLRVTLRQARQAFQPNQPYSRVVNDLDL